MSLKVDGKGCELFALRTQSYIGIGGGCQLVCELGHVILPRPDLDFCLLFELLCLLFQVTLGQKGLKFGAFCA